MSPQRPSCFLCDDPIRWPEIDHYCYFLKLCAVQAGALASPTLSPSPSISSLSVLSQGDHCHSRHGFFYVFFVPRTCLSPSCPDMCCLRKGFAASLHFLQTIFRAPFLTVAALGKDKDAGFLSKFLAPSGAIPSCCAPPSFLYFCKAPILVIACHPGIYRVADSALFFPHIGNLRRDLSLLGVWIFPAASTGRH